MTSDLKIRTKSLNGRKLGKIQTKTELLRLILCLDKPKIEQLDDLLCKETERCAGTSETVLLGTAKSWIPWIINRPIYMKLFFSENLFKLYTHCTTSSFKKSALHTLKTGRCEKISPQAYSKRAKTRHEMQWIHKALTLTYRHGAVRLTQKN